MTSVPRRVGATVAAAMLVLGALFGVRTLRDEEPLRVSGVYENAATQDIAYRVGDRPGQDLAGAMDYTRIRMKRPAHKGGGYVIRPKPGEWSRVRNLHESMLRLRTRLRNAPVGAMWVIKSRQDGYAIQVLKVDLNPAMVANTPGTPAVDIIVGTVAAHFGWNYVQEWGICVCKRISGTSRWSQHAYCNAVDLGSGDRARLDRVYTYIDGLRRQGYVPVAQTLWRVPGHYSHIHYSGAPMRYGSPTAC